MGTARFRNPPGKGSRSMNERSAGRLKHPKVVALVSLAASTVALPGAAQVPDRGRVAAIDSMIAEKMEADGIPGLSIAIALDGRRVFARGYGLADVEDSVPVRPETAFRSASIGKPMTAAAVMQLEERGRIELDAAIQRYCPTFPRKRATIAIRHLLAHLSGIRHYGGPRNDEEVFNTRRYASVVDALEIFAADPLLHEPGERYVYSTFGYNVLGCVIEGAAGEPYLDYMARHVFEAAGMTSTWDDDPFAIIPYRAAGYRRVDGELRHARWVDMSSKLPAGGFVTTAPDLVAFASALMDGTLVSRETFERMLAPQTTTAGDTIPYGLGLGLFPDELWYGEREAFHGGGTPGVSGMLYLLPDRRFAVAILMNLEGVGDRVALTAEIARVVLALGS